MEKTKCVFLLGGFDGLHIGHKSLIERAKTFRLPVVMMTIDGIKGTIGRRSVCVDKLFYNEDGTMKHVEQTR